MGLSNLDFYFRCSCNSSFCSILLATRSSANSFIVKLDHFSLAACAGDDLEVDLDEFVLGKGSSITEANSSKINFEFTLYFTLALIMKCFVVIK